MILWSRDILPTLNVCFYSLYSVFLCCSHLTYTLIWTLHANINNELIYNEINLSPHHEISLLVHQSAPLIGKISALANEYSLIIYFQTV